MTAQQSTSTDLRWAVVVIFILLLILVINPIGFLGGGWDDWQYLNAARCWAEYGACLPTTHWSGRWPVFVPIAVLISWFGESRFVVGLWPLVSSVAALAMLVLVGNRVAGRPAGWLAAITILLTPAFSIQLLDPSIEALELALVLWGVLMLLIWRERRGIWSAFLCGLAFGLAFQVRETAIIAAVFAAVAAVLWQPRFPDLLAAASGFAAPLAVELLVYWHITGDALYRRHLSLAHTLVPSAELRGPIDTHHGPFFNLSNIANWRHEPGLHLHWSIDGLANLFVNAKAGFTLALTPLFLLLYQRTFPAATRKLAWRLYGIGLLYIAIIIYALAMDPKARVMLVPLSIIAIAFSIVLIELRRTGRTLMAGTALAGQIFIGLSVLWVHQRTDILEAPAAQWLARYRGEIMADANTRATLTLVPGADRLPDINSGKPLWLYLSVQPCRDFIARARFPDQPVVVIDHQPTSVISKVAPQYGGALCLLKMGGQSEAMMRNAIDRSRIDGPAMLGPHFNRYAVDQ